MGKHTRIDGLDDLDRKLDKIADANPNVKGVKVGVVETARYPVGTMQGRPDRKTPPMVAQVAFWNEFGTKGGGWGGRIPERPFMRQSYAKFKEDKRVSLLIKHGIDAANPADVRDNANLLGVILQGIMQKEFRIGGFEANAPATIAIKTKGKGGSTTPLIDTSHLIQSISYKIIDRMSTKETPPTGGMTGR